MEESCLLNLFYALLIFQVVAGAIIMTSLVAQYMADKVLKDHERRIRSLEQSDGNFSNLYYRCYLILLFIYYFHVNRFFRKVFAVFLILFQLFVCRQNNIEEKAKKMRRRLQLLLLRNGGLRGEAVHRTHSVR